MRFVASRLLFVAIWCVGSGWSAPPLLLKNVRVVDVRNETASQPTRVLIQDSRIKAVHPRANASGAQVVDCGGKFLIPGLWDMHVHVGEIEEDWFPLYLANGLTGLREMAASRANAPKQRSYERDIDTGKRIGPRLVWTLGPIDRKQTAEQARIAVRDVKVSGASFIKVYNDLSRDAYRAVISESFREQLPVTGHVPDAVRWPEAIEAGQRSIEHLDGMLLACALRETEARRMLLLNQDPTALILSSFNPAHLDLLASMAARAQTWHTPTLAMLRFFANPQALTNDPRLQYARTDYLDDWRTQSKRTMDNTQARHLFARQKEAVRALHRSGAPILAGTDTPNPFCIPGFALHDELALLVEAGLSSAAALRSATWEPARYLGRESVMGSVEAGKLADLVLLDANPLSDIRNTSRIAGVVMNGRWLDRSRLNRMLETVRSRVQRSAIH